MDFRPKTFIPRQNPFYVALPYNDVCKGEHKPEASRVIPWFHREFSGKGQSVCKGRWVQIIYNKRSCFAQWEDCGPFTTEDWPYVFGDKPPVNTHNKGAGIDISPAVRDYLGIPGGTAIVHWRFVEFYRIPRGPWSKWGDNNPFVNPSLGPGKRALQTREDRLRQQQEAIQRELLRIHRNSGGNFRDNPIPPRSCNIHAFYTFLAATAGWGEKKSASTPLRKRWRRGGRYPLCLFHRGTVPKLPRRADENALHAPQ